MKPIDLRPILDRIRREHAPDHHRSAEAYAAAAALWGGGANEHGSFADACERVTLAKGPTTRWRGVAHIACAPNGLWAAGIWCDHGSGSSISGPGIWNDTAYRSRADALAAAALDLALTFEAVRRRDHGASDHAIARRLAAELRTLAQPPAPVVRQMEMAL